MIWYNMSKTYEVTEKRMPDGTLAYGFHRVLLVDDACPLGTWKCQDCGKQWAPHPYNFKVMQEDRVCEPEL